MTEIDRVPVPPDRYRTAIENSRVVTAYGTSRIGSLFRRLRRDDDRTWGPSARRINEAVKRSRVGGGGARCIAAANHSYTFRWLAEAPHEEIAVVDLRNTTVVGPFFRVVERMYDALARVPNPMGPVPKLAWLERTREITFDSWTGRFLLAIHGILSRIDEDERSEGRR